jgi:hypothetical protein
MGGHRSIKLFKAGLGCLHHSVRHLLAYFNASTCPLNRHRMKQGIF